MPEDNQGGQAHDEKIYLKLCDYVDGDSKEFLRVSVDGEGNIKFRAYGEPEEDPAVIKEALKDLARMCYLSESEEAIKRRTGEKEGS